MVADVAVVALAAAGLGRLRREMTAANAADDFGGFGHRLLGNRIADVHFRALRLPQVVEEGGIDIESLATAGGSVDSQLKLEHRVAVLVGRGLVVDYRQRIRSALVLF